MATERRSLRGPLLRRHRKGQALVEFAIVLPILLLVLGGIIQFGILFWAQNTVTQIARDTGRWAATQPASPCDPTDRGPLVTQADRIATTSSLIGYAAGQWSGSAMALGGPRPQEGVQAGWAGPTGALPADCAPKDNSTVWWVTVTVNHVVPVFVPGIQYMPGLGTCDASGCHISLTSSAQYRMEPAP
jgi:Flp pilus assembly protein TadG